ncbi:MAG: TIGR02300 family protein [Alphaproteobacteria bacterium]|nr:TIGR02300 family protein [Alphaproteobacteria bacterium]
MSKPELGTKRTCPETERKFYDLNRDPIVSPYTGKSYPLSFFEVGETPVAPPKVEPEKKEEAETPEAETETDDVEIVSLEDADDEASDTGETIPDIDGDDDDDVDLGDDDDNTFLETDDDDDDDVTGIVNVGDDSEET